MSKTPSQVTTIGFFILTATVLLVAMLIAFGGSSWMKSTVTYTMHFNTSVKGLSPGSAVLFRGVKIGQVTEIRLLSPGEQPAVVPQAGQELNYVHFPVQVTVEIDPEMLGFPNGVWYNIFRFNGFGITTKDDLEAYLADMVLKQGLRAKLLTVSMLTGQLAIELSFEPIDAEQDNLEHITAGLKNNVFPTRMGFLDQVSSRIGEKNFRNQMESIQKLIAQVADFIESGRSKQLMDDVAVIAANLRASSDMLKEQLPPLLTESHSTIADAKEFVGSANARLQPLLDQTQHLMARLGLASDAAKVLLNSLNNLTNASKPQLDKLLANLNNTVGEAELTLKDTRATLHDVQGVIAPDSPVRLQLVQTLDDAQHTLDALRTLLDNLNRNPQILLLGE